MLASKFWQKFSNHKLINVFGILVYQNMVREKKLIRFAWLQEIYRVPV
jgi:hypothetical protein